VTGVLNAKLRKYRPNVRLLRLKTQVSQTFYLDKGVTKGELQLISIHDDDDVYLI
jgi:hypothetical protein